MTPEQLEQNGVTMRDACTFGFACFGSAATAPASLTANNECDGARVSGHMASQTRTFPHFHGSIESPSGLFPSDQKRPVGSRWLGILADSNACLMMSFIVACRD